MLFLKPHKEILAFVNLINEHLLENKHAKLSKTQMWWLAICMTAMLVTNRLSWECFERATAGNYKARALGFMFKKAKIPWDRLFSASMQLVISLHGISEGSLVVDDTERKRSKNTKKIWGVHKLKDKKTNGFIKGQEFVILLLVTRTISLPVGFSIYCPDPNLQIWKEADESLPTAGHFHGE